MTGRSIDLKKTVPFLRMGEDLSLYRFGFYNWALTHIKDETRNDNKIEPSKADILDRCSDIPCSFTSEPNWGYFIKLVPYTQKQMERDPYNCYEGIVLSAYKPLIDNFFAYSLNTRHCNIAILMMSEGIFAGAIYKEGQIVASKEFVSVKSAMSSKSGRFDYCERVKDLLQKWESHLSSSDLVLIRCTYDDKLYFFDGMKREIQDSRYRHIPFETGKPTLVEVDRVYDRLMRYEVHDTIANTLKEFRNKRKNPEVSNTPNVNAVENKRRMEKKMWPWMDSGLAKRLVEYVENDDGNGLYDVVQAHSKKSKLIEYLNSFKEKFNNGTFLHFAVQKEAISAVEVLLELGCDPTATDDNNKVAFEYCRTKDMQEVFIEFRSQNPNFFNWNKAKVPEETNVPLHNERKKEVESPKKHDISRKKRSEKLKNKKITNYE